LAQFGGLTYVLHNQSKNQEKTRKMNDLSSVFLKDSDRISFHIAGIGLNPVDLPTSLPRHWQILPGIGSFQQAVGSLGAVCADV
jgi:hypothetical protein